MRRLHQSQHRIFQETADGGLQEDARGDVVAVENADKLPVGQGQRMVKVPRFGVLVVVTGDIAHADVGGEHGKLTAFAIIQKIDLHFIFWIINALCRQDGIAHHLQRFVIARNIDIDRRPLAHIIRQWNNAALQRPDRLQVVKQQHHPDIDLRQKESHSENGFNGRVEVQGLREAKIHVTRGHQQRRDDHNDRYAAALAEAHQKENTDT